VASKQSRRQLRRTSEPGAAASTREKLIEAAGHVFAERGYHATTVREIDPESQSRSQRRGVAWKIVSAES
jgi:hypothetical protein